MNSSRATDLWSRSSRRLHGGSLVERRQAASRRWGGVDLSVSSAVSCIDCALEIVHGSLSASARQNLKEAAHVET